MTEPVRNAPSALPTMLRFAGRRLRHRLSGGATWAGHPATRLTPREVDVLAQVAVGCSNIEVATRLSLRVETVKSYLKTAMVKLDSRNRGEAVFTAQRAGLIP